MLQREYDASTHFDTLYRRTPAEFAFRAKSEEDWRVWQAAFRPRLRQALGLDVIAADLQGYQPQAECLSNEAMDQGRPEHWDVHLHFNAREQYVREYDSQQTNAMRRYPRVNECGTGC